MVVKQLWLQATSRRYDRARAARIDEKGEMRWLLVTLIYLVLRWALYCQGLPWRGTYDDGPCPGSFLSVCENDVGCPYSA